MNEITPLPVEFYLQDTLTVAKSLLGKALVINGLSGIIVETEAYIGTDDKACHASVRKKETCFPMWERGGVSYVYLTYGMHYMFNVVTEKEGFPAAVLIRALEPLSGIQQMVYNRGIENTGQLTNGPGKLTKALGIDKSHNNTDLLKTGAVYIAERQTKPIEIVESERIGIEYAKEYKNKLWRFYIKDNKYVSKK
jgi:DNA-3-methyladenine glycosylase